MFGEITDIRTEKTYDIKKSYTLHALVSEKAEVAYVQLLNSTDQGAKQFEVDLSTGTVKILVDKDSKYECYLYLIGKDGLKVRIYQGDIEFKDTIKWQNAILKQLQGIIDSFKDNISGIWNLITNPKEIWQAVNFIGRAIIPGTEEQAILDKMIQENVGDLLYDIMNEMDKEQAYYIMGYVEGEILFSIITGKVASEIKDMMPKLKSRVKQIFGKEPPKALQGAIEEVSDELREATAKHADDVLETVEKYGDDVKEKAQKFVDDVVDESVRHADDVGQTSNVVSKTLSELIQEAKKKYSDITEDLIKHIFGGEINAKGNAVGFHYEGISDAAGKVVEIIDSPNAQGVYRAKVMVNGVVKQQTSTFFPKSWTPEQVLDAIQEAFDNRVLKTGKKMQYTGMSKSGIKIEMYIDNGIILSAYPVM